MTFVLFSDFNQIIKPTVKIYDQITYTEITMIVYDIKEKTVLTMINKNRFLPFYFSSV